MVTKGRQEPPTGSTCLLVLSPIYPPPNQSKLPLKGIPDHVTLFLEICPRSADFVGRYSDLTRAAVSSFIHLHSSLCASIPATPILSGSAQEPRCPMP